MMRIATYNIRKCVGLDWRRRPCRIMRVLAEINADIVALQEADRRLGNRPATLDADALLKMTGLRIARPDTVGCSSGWHGNTILVRDGIEVLKITCVDLPSLEPRGALIVDLVIDGLALRVAGVHLGLRSSNRRRQARALVRELQILGDSVPTVILGDLNEWRTRGGAIGVLSKRFQPSPHRPSFHTSAPVASLDRIFTGPGLRIETIGAHQSEVSRRASDHLPVWADIAAVERGRNTGIQLSEAAIS